jgi:hypothetical protein
MHVRADVGWKDKRPNLQFDAAPRLMDSYKAPSSDKPKPPKKPK